MFGRWSCNVQALIGDTEGRDCTAPVKVCWDRGVWIGRVLLRRWSSNGHSLVTLGRHCAQSLFISPRRCNSSYLGDVLAMAGDMEGETKWLLLQSSKMELSKWVKSTQKMVMKWQHTQPWHWRHYTVRKKKIVYFHFGRVWGLAWRVENRRKCR